MENGNWKAGDSTTRRTWVGGYIYRNYLRIPIVPKLGEPQDNAVATIALKADFVEAVVGNVKQKKPSLSLNGQMLDGQAVDKADVNFA